MDLLCLLAATASLAAPNLVERMVADGFEHVAIARGPLTVLAFEDRRDVDPARGLGRVARMALEDSSLGPELELVPRHEGRGVLGVRMDRADLADFMAGRLQSSRFAERLRFDLAPPSPGPDSNPAAGHLDLALSPGYAFSDHLTAYLSPTLRMPLANDLLFKGRLRTRVYPDLSIEGGYGVMGGDLPLAPGVWGGWLVGGWEVGSYGVMGSVGGLVGPVHWNVLASVMTAQAGAARVALECPTPWWDSFVRGGASIRREIVPCSSPWGATSPVPRSSWATIAVIWAINCGRPWSPTWDPCAVRIRPLGEGISPGS